MSLGDLFPEEDYRFHLTLRRAAPEAFFRPRDRSGRIRQERAHWINDNRARYAALLPEGQDVLAEFGEHLVSWGLCARSPKTITELGVAVEADVLLLARFPDGGLRLAGGALCFPTGWALEEKLGMTMDAIHGPVPGLNAALGSPIDQFLSRLKPGAAFLRDNWGIAATDALNLHPARAVPPPMPPVQLDRLWLRVEHQALLSMPRASGVVFAIRIALHRLDGVAGTEIAPRLRRALQTMPSELAHYKRIEAIRAELVERL